MRRLLRTLTATAAIALVLGGTAGAQTPLALENIGADVRLPDAATEGRGGWGLTVRDTLAPSFHNLASLTGLRNVVLLMAGYGERLHSEEGDQERTTNTVRTPTLRAAFPFAAGRIVLSAGFQAMRGTQYDRADEESGVLLDPLAPEDTVAAYTVLHRFTREGTQFRVPLGLSWRVVDALSVAASVNLEDGVFRERASDIYVEPLDAAGNPLLRATLEYLEDDLDGTSTTWSLLWSPGDRFALGGNYTPAHDWDIDRKRDMTGLPGQAGTTYGVHLPALYELGLSWRWNDRWRVGVDGDYQDFGEFAGREDWAVSMTEAWRLSLGIERTERFRRRGGMSNLPLRCGIMRQQWPYRVHGAVVHETRISVGTGVPLHQRRGHLDVAVSYGWRGGDDVGISDHYWRLSVSVAGLERWW